LVVLFQPHAILESKWEVSGSRHFDQKCTLYPSKDYLSSTMDIARVFINDIVRLHGIPKKIILDKGSVFIGIFWMSFQEALGTNLISSTTYHPEIDG
jgi:hypothetical protein